MPSTSFRTQDTRASTARKLNSLLVGESDAGAEITAEVTATNSEGSATVVTAPVGPVVPTEG